MYIRRLANLKANFNHKLNFIIIIIAMKSSTIFSFYGNTKCAPRYLISKYKICITPDLFNYEKRLNE